MVQSETRFSHRLGGAVDLPLLVPAFTSKGFSFFAKGSGPRKRFFSATTNALSVFGPFINESFLISAYDLHHKHFKKPSTYFRNTSLVFLDSGGYELSPDFDSSEPKLTSVRKLEFSSKQYQNLLVRLQEKKSQIPSVIASKIIK